MKKEEIISYSGKLYEDQGGFILGNKPDVLPEYTTLKLYDAPLVGFGSAEDSLFDEFKKTGVIGPWHMSPREWLPQAKTVISFFFPTSEEVRRSNYGMSDMASMPWLYARIEGQALIASYVKAMAEYITKISGASCCVPQADPRWQGIQNGKGIEGYAEITSATFGSRWSERHAAYVCGLGTFGLSKGLITRRGMAGRFGSIITDLDAEPDVRPYTDIYDYCIHCNACVKRCPVGAIDPVTGKDHILCSNCLDKSKERFHPRYGCGLCQTAVPCEAKNPSAMQQ